MAKVLGQRVISVAWLWKFQVSKNHHNLWEKKKCVSVVQEHLHGICNRKQSTFPNTSSEMNEWQTVWESCLFGNYVWTEYLQNEITFILNSLNFSPLSVSI